MEVISYLNIDYCDNLQDLNGLNNLKYAGNGNYYSGISLNGNNGILNLKGLENLVDVRGSFSVSHNNRLLNFQGLESLKTIAHSVYIDHNESLTDIENLSGLELLSEFSLKSNNNLKELPNFINLTTLDFIVITYNNMLIDLVGFNNLTQLNDLVIRNSNISSLNGLNNLEQLRTLNIEVCKNLVDFQSLSNLSSIGSGGMQVKSNAKIENFQGFENLFEIRGDIDIAYNPSLLSLDGLESLNTIGQNIDIHIYHNKALSDFCALFTPLNNNQFHGDYQANDNLINPSIQDIIDGNCN